MRRVQNWAKVAARPSFECNRLQLKLGNQELGASEIEEQGHIGTTMRPNLSQKASPRLTPKDERQGHRTVDLPREGRGEGGG